MHKTHPVSEDSGFTTSGTLGTPGTVSVAGPDLKGPVERWAIPQDWFHQACPVAAAPAGLGPTALDQAPVREPPDSSLSPRWLPLTCPGGPGREHRPHPGRTTISQLRTTVWATPTGGSVNLSTHPPPRSAGAGSSVSAAAFWATSLRAWMMSSCAVN